MPIWTNNSRGDATVQFKDKDTGKIVTVTLRPGESYHQPDDPPLFVVEDADWITPLKGMPGSARLGQRLTALNAQGEAVEAVVVPVEATHAMAKVGEDARWQSAVRDANNVREIWRAMIAAANG